MFLAQFMGIKGINENKTINGNKSTTKIKKLDNSFSCN